MHPRQHAASKPDAAALIMAGSGAEVLLIADTLGEVAQQLAGEPRNVEGALFGGVKYLPVQYRMA